MFLYQLKMMYWYIPKLAIIGFQWRGPNGLIAMVGRMVSLCTVCGTSCYWTGGGIFSCSSRSSWPCVPSCLHDPGKNTTSKSRSAPPPDVCPLGTGSLMCIDMHSCSLENCSTLLTSFPSLKKSTRDLYGHVFTCAVKMTPIMLHPDKRPKRFFRGSRIKWTRWSAINVTWSNILQRECLNLMTGFSSTSVPDARHVIKNVSNSCD